MNLKNFHYLTKSSFPGNQIWGLENDTSKNQTLKNFIFLMAKLIINFSYLIKQWLIKNIC